MKEKISILFVGSSKYPMYVSSFFYAALDIDGVEPTLFDTEVDRRESFLYRLEQNFAVGCSVNRTNKRLIEEVLKKKYDIVFLYSARTINTSTIRVLKNKGIYVATYCNDNPFSNSFRSYFWRFYKAQVKLADITYVYRNSNIEEAKECGCNNVKLLMSYYIKSRNYPLINKKKEIKCPKVLFLGHRENDGREIYIKKLMDSGITIGVPDYEWKDFEPNNPYLVRLKDTQKYYNEYLNECSIAIVFLSSINKDTYTRRCFEIPAVKKMMIAPETDDILSMFEEDKEIVIYRSLDDFIKKIRFYLDNNEARNSIALAGYKRVMKDGHEVTDRVKMIVSDYLEYKEKCNEYI